MKVSKLKPNPTNPRLIKDERFEKLVKSIQEFPKGMELRPIVVDDEMMILGGNMRLKAIQHLGMKDIPDEWVKKASDLSEEERQRFIIMDNVGFGEWDWDVIANEWNVELVKEWGLEIPVFDTKEAHEDDFVMPDEIQTDIVLGDLFEIGEHRLLCGDSTKAEDVSKLLSGAKPVLMVTDPPYGVKYDPTRRHKAGINDSGRVGKVENDERIDWSLAYRLFEGDVCYVWHGGRHAKEVAENLNSTGFEIVCQIVWNKQQMVFSRGDYHWKHEPCWYAVRKGKNHNWQGDRKQTTVWDIESILQASKHGKENDAQTHGTQKPVECMARPIRNNSKEGDSVYDPFLGSGTTMVAAHQLNRKCFGIEISPQYCQIILNRMLKLDPDLVVKKNGNLLELKQVEEQV